MLNLLNSQVAKATKFALLFLGVGASTVAYSQDEEVKPALQLAGSIDTYYKYDFAKKANIGTSFANDHGSFSIGMFNLIASQQVGKASFVGDVAVGPRNAGSAGDGLNASIQNLYFAYQFTDKFSVTAGYMGTFVGYEVISPVPNYNYSTSYLFTNGPFQNAGVRFKYAFSEKVSLMAGVFNDWNVYSDEDGAADFGAQLFVSPAEGWSAYFNVITGPDSGTAFDLTTSYQITDKFLLGLNAAKRTTPDDAGGFAGAALYANYALTETFGLGFRGETFTDDRLGILVDGEKRTVNAFTLSGNIKAGPIRFIPEFRFDAADAEVFSTSDDAGSKSATQVLMAAVYSF